MRKEYKVTTPTLGEVSIQIEKHSNFKITGLNTEQDGNRALMIWKMYKNYRSNDVVVRSGSGLCGVYRFDPKHPLKTDYVESDTLHSTTVEELARNIFRYHPVLFYPSEQERIVNLLRYHDLGETVDNPDDGSKDKDEKFEEELATFIEKTAPLRLNNQMQLIQDFIIFENASSDYWTYNDCNIMQFAKLCDKTDAPLGALLYEAQDRPGSLLFKKEHFGGITDQDQKYADEIGEFSQAGIWTAHMIDTYLYYRDIELFIEILIEACKDVRGFVFPWMYEFCKKRGISQDLLDKML